MPYEIAPTSSFATEEHVQEHLEGLLDDGHDEDEMKEFIKTHGNKDFLCYFEEPGKLGTLKVDLDKFGQINGSPLTLPINCFFVFSS